MPQQRGRLLLVGATGFVGRHLYPALAEAGWEARCTSRQPEAARSRYPNRDWVRVEADDPSTLAPALAGCRAAVYLVHAMGGEGEYEARESAAASAFRRAAEEAGLERIVYLGGMPPRGTASRHLRSRLAVGRILREGSVPTFELQAAMIIGAGSESWTIVRDLSVRLPLMVLPKWLRSRSQPIAVGDVVFAVTRALELPAEAAGAYPLPGPEAMTAREILFRVARLRGTRPLTVSVPVVTPRLSSYWIELVTRANHNVARELVEGLTCDLVADDEGFWKLFPDHRRLGFEEAARLALDAENRALPLRTQLAEGLLRRVARRERRRAR